MPQKRSILPQEPPVNIHQPNLPQGDPNALEGLLLRFGGGMVGDQKPGDAASGLGALAAMLPIGKLLAAFRAEGAGGQAVNMGDKLLREHSMPPEFAPMDVGQHPPLDPGELQKMLDLVKTSPQAPAGPIRKVVK